MNTEQWRLWQDWGVSKEDILGHGFDFFMSLGCKNLEPAAEDVLLGRIQKKKLKKSLNCSRSIKSRERFTLSVRNRIKLSVWHCDGQTRGVISGSLSFSWKANIRNGEGDCVSWGNQFSKRTLAGANICPNRGMLLYIRLLSRVYSLCFYSFLCLLCCTFERRVLTQSFHYSITHSFRYFSWGLNMLVKCEYWLLFSFSCTIFLNWVCLSILSIYTEL